MHVTIDGFGGNPNLLGNLELVRKLIDRYPDEIGMTKHLAQTRSNGLLSMVKQMKFYGLAYQLKNG